MRAPIRTDYRKASVERLKEARLLIDAEQYVGAIYLAGTATESMIKAFIAAKGGDLTSHNVERLATEAKFDRRLRPTTRERVLAAVSQTSNLWRNLFRYCTAADLHRFGLEKNISIEVAWRSVRYANAGEDGIRLWAECLYNQSSLIVQEGELLWQSKNG